MKILLTILCSFSMLVALGHEIRPAYLQFIEHTDGSIDILWKQPVMGKFSIPLRPSISSGWMIDSTATNSYTENYLIRQWHITPHQAELNGQTIHIDGLEKTLTDVLLNITWSDGNTASYLLKASAPSIKLTAESKNNTPVQSYLWLGMEHIWSGIDHLLFVLGLLLLVNNRKKLFLTITTFTIAHSITLALATFKIIEVASAFAETCIALSIVFLAVELARHYRGHNGITYQYPWIVAFAFGLLHGLGFAGALTSIGLPQQSIPTALLLFNVGVEVGQLIFVFVVLAIMHFIQKIIQSRVQQLRWVPVYTIGSLAAFWFVERMVVLFNF